MKRSLPGWLLAACLLANPLARGGEWQAGAAKVDVTPEKPIRLSGYGSRVSPSEGIEQRIFARALVLKDEAGVPTVIVAVDAIGIPAWVRERVVGAIRGRTGIYHVRLVVAATHTHYAPNIKRSLHNLSVMTPEEKEVVDEYSEKLVEKIVQAIDLALERLARATVEHGKGRAGFAKNRRTEGGPVDQDLPILAVKGSDGKLIAVVFNYACHATTIPAEQNLVSGDWPGYAAEYLEASHPGAVALPLIGCGADANPHPRGEASHSRRHGRELADAAGAVLAGKLESLPPRIDAQLELVPLRFGRLPTAAELEARLGSGPEHVRRHARLQLDRIAREGKLPETYSYPVQVWSIGRGMGDGILWVFLAGEVVVDYSIRLRKELEGRNVWVTAYANDIPCYIPSRRVLAEGGYEADDSMYWYGQPTRWDPSIEDAIVEKALVLARGLADPISRVKPPPPMSPVEALASFEHAGDVRIELAAAEPQVTDPVAIAFDEKGRMYAAEMRDYPLGPGEGKPFDGRVRLLQDADGDGRFETSTVFAERIPYANGIACSKGGVYVTCVPDILFLEDTDGDGKDDVRKVAFTGFRPGNSQHLVNSLQRGLDNWIYGNGGDAAALTRPLRPGSPPVLLEHQSFRFHPVTLEVEPVTGHRGGFGISFHERGDRFVCDNQSHVIHVVLEQPYLERNPDFGVGDTMENPTDHGARVFGKSRTLERFNDPQDYGRFSSACGVHIYGGDALPPKYRGSHFSCEPVSNLVHRDVLEPSGASFIARRGEESTEFLRSADHWFRPVNCATGPDGALYIVDMYREVIEHPEWIPAHIQKYFDLRSGMDRGRIYRIAAAAPGAAGSPPASGGAAARAATKPALPARGDARALAAGLSHPSSWRRETAQRLLVEEGGRSAVPLLDAALRESREPAGRLRALWTLDGIGVLEPGAIVQALGDASADVRASAAVLAERRIRGGKNEHSLDLEALRKKLAGLAGDPDPRVRFQAALSSTALEPTERAAALAAIASSDASDSWARTAVLIASVDDVTPLIRALASTGEPEGGRADIIEAASDLAGARKRRGEVLDVMELLTDTDAGRDASAAWRLRALAALFRRLGPDGVQRALAGDPEGKAPAEPGKGGKAEKSTAGAAGRIRPRLVRLFEALAERASDDAADLAERIEALDLLGYDAGAAAVSLLTKFLDARHPADLQKAAVRSLARARGPEVTPLLLDAFQRLTPRVREEVLDALLSDTERTRALLDALEKGTVAPNEIDLERRKRLIDGLADADRARAERALASVAPDPDRAAVIEKYSRAFAAKDLAAGGDPGRGKDLFIQKCSICHRAGSEGSALGADLAGMRGKEVDAILADILDPSRAAAPEFLGYVLLTRDGRALTGLLALETPANVVIKGPSGKTENVLRRDIQELRATGKSAMPDGLERELDPLQMLDVIAFIKAGIEGGKPPLRGGEGGGELQPAGPR